MADVTISDLTPRQPTGAAVIPYSENGTTYQSTASQLVSLASGVPTGVIVMWYGSIASIPAGWALCDGTNSTPNLVDRFVLGAGTTTPAVATTGGSKDAVVVSHTHAVTDPGHSHGVYINGTGTGAGFNNNNRGYALPATTSATTGITIAATGQSGTNANLPPYYALAYIMKL